MMAIMEKRRKEAEAKDNEKWMDGKGRCDRSRSFLEFLLIIHMYPL